MTLTLRWAGLATPIFMGRIIDSTTSTAGKSAAQKNEELTESALAMVVFFSIQSVFAGVRAGLFDYCGERVVPPCFFFSCLPSVSSCHTKQVARLRKTVFNSIIRPAPFTTSGPTTRVFQ